MSLQPVSELPENEKTTIFFACWKFFEKVYLTGVRMILEGAGTRGLNMLFSEGL